MRHDSDISQPKPRMAAMVLIYSEDAILPGIVIA
jgi:hypothetical protein